MEQRDYLKKQSDQLGQVLAKLFSDLLALKNSGQINDGPGITNQTLKTELDVDIQDILEIPAEKFIETLTAQKKLTNENFDKLAEILLLISDNQNEQRKKLYEKCLTIYEYLQRAESSYSLDRQWKIKRLQNEI